MLTTAVELRTCVLFLIHAGLTELRLLGYEHGSHEQIAHLADVLEFLPGLLACGKELDFELIREQFEQYAKKYPDSMGQRYLDHLDGRQPIPAHF